MYISISQLLALGITKEEICANLSCGQWQLCERGSVEKSILVSSLPLQLQIKWVLANPLGDGHIASLLDETENYALAENEDKIIKLLACLPAQERTIWLRECLRLARLVQRYHRIMPKRYRNPITQKLEFVAEISPLCQEAICKEPLILERQPYRAMAPSPYTLDRWHRAYEQEGLLAFLHSISKPSCPQPDNRRVNISPAAQEWVNKNWRRFHSPRFLYRALKEEALKQGWTIPSESWLYRLWQQMPAIVKTSHHQGRQAYEAKYAVFVPRDYTDLEPLQVLCGDHSERDVTVLLPDATLRRPWLTIWYDLRTGLIWGWHLALIPSSVTAALAYADGVQNYGAQPPSRPADGYFSYIYTDRGRDYRSHHWDGKVIAVHKAAMQPCEGLQFLCLERKIGILADLELQHLLARRRNAKEKPVERVFKDISAWERNSFAEYCASSPDKRPQAWSQLYRQHQLYLNGKAPISPFISLEHYRQRLAEFITTSNSTTHHRPTLRSEAIVPLDEFRRLYTTRYQIRPETLALILLKAQRRVIRKNGVQCFQKHWFYYHEAMSRYKGLSVEVRYSDGDYSKVWVLLPDGELCQAELVSPTSLLKPNKQTLKMVIEARKSEHQLIRDYEFIQHSTIRGETTEERVEQSISKLEAASSLPTPSPKQANIHILNRLDHQKLTAVVLGTVTVEQVARAQADTSIFEMPQRGLVSEYEQTEEET